MNQKIDGNTIFTDYWKVLVLIFSEMRNAVFLCQKVDGNMVFTDYWKGLVLNFLVIGNTVFFRVKKLIERLYLLVTEKFLFWTFRWWKIRSFFQPKSWWKDDIYLVFLSFTWYSRAWEIWFFAQRIFLMQEVLISLFYNTNHSVNPTKITFVITLLPILVLMVCQFLLVLPCCSRTFNISWIILL